MYAHSYWANQEHTYPILSSYMVPINTIIMQVRIRITNSKPLYEQQLSTCLQSLVILDNKLHNYSLWI